MLQCLRADLHIHSCLSPCADITMSPKRIVEQATSMKLHVIAICDHNSAENVQAAIKVAKKTPLTVLPGMEITTSEEVHVLAIFPTIDAVMSMQVLVYEKLAPGENKEELFGEQIIANEKDEVEGYNSRMLIGATAFSIEETVEEIHNLGGLAIASHVDREVFGIIGQLGFIPEKLPLDALEISSGTSYTEAARNIPQIARYAVVSSSDAHSLDQIGRKFTEFWIERPTIDEMKKAFLKTEGRRVMLEA